LHGSELRRQADRGPFEGRWLPIATRIPNALRRHRAREDGLWARTMGIVTRSVPPCAALDHQLSGNRGGNAVQRSVEAHVPACL